MTQKSLPYFPFFPNDWLGSMTVRSMSLEEKAIYLELLCCAWNGNPPPFLPADETKLSRLVMATPDEWRRCRDAVLERFPLTEDRTHRHNPKLSKIYAKMLAKNEKLSAAANARWQDSPSTLPSGRTTPAGEASNAPATGGAPSDSPSVPSSNKRGGGYSPEFNRFVAVYPRKTHKAAAWKVWPKAMERVDIETLIASVEAHKDTDQWEREDGRFVPSMATYLKECLWEDEVEPNFPQPGEEGYVPPAEAVFLYQFREMKESGWTEDDLRGHFGDMYDELAEKVAVQ